jgi:hypothetical protein
MIIYIDPYQPMITYKTRNLGHDTVIKWNWEKLITKR